MSRRGAAGQRPAAGMGLGCSYENNSALRNTDEGYHGAELVYEEMRQAMHTTIGGITWERPRGHE